MRRLVALLGVVAIAAGCASKEAGDQAAGSEAAADVATEAATAVKDYAEDAMESAQDAVAAAIPEGMVALTGNLGCGHCNYEVTDGCTAAMKTEDGVVHILESDDPAVFEARQSGQEIRVVGTTMEKDGLQYVTVETFEM